MDLPPTPIQESFAISNPSSARSPEEGRGMHEWGRASSPPLPPQVLITLHLCKQTPVPGSVAGADQSNGWSGGRAVR